MFLNGYPYTDFHEMNLDFLLQSMNTLKQDFSDFTASNSLIFADPIYHDITSSYAKNTIVIDAEGNAYISKQIVPSGIQLGNTDYWMLVFDFEGYVERANKNFTVNYFSNVTRSDRTLEVGDWLVLDDVLYKVIVDIPVDGLFEVGVNIVHFTVEEFLKDFTTSITNLVNQYKDDIDASELAYQAAMQAEVDRILAGATVDSEVIDARLGADGVNYATLGLAIRTQVDDLRDYDEDISTLLAHDTLGLTYDSLSSTPSSTGSWTLSPYVPVGLDDDCIVTKVKINVDTAGTISFGVYHGTMTTGQTVTEDDITYIETVTVTQTGEVEITLPIPIVVGKNAHFMYGRPTDTCVTKFGGTAYNRGFLLLKVYATGTSQSDNHACGLEITYEKQNLRNIFDTTNSTENYIITNTTGQMTYDASAVACTDFLFVGDCSHLYIKDTSGYNHLGAFYDENRRFLSGILISSADAAIGYKISVPSGAVYIRDSYTVALADVDNHFVYGVIDYGKEDNHINDYVNYPSTYKDIFTTKNATKGVFIGSDGQEHSLSNSNGTDYIDISEYKNPVRFIPTWSGGYQCAWYDSNYDVIGGVNTTLIEGVGVEWVLPSTAKYIRFSYRNDLPSPKSLMHTNIIDSAIKAENATGYENFTYSVATGLSNNDDTTTSLQDSASVADDRALLMLPLSYSKTGPSTKLVICQPGTNTYITSGTTSISNVVIPVAQLLAEGYACLQVNGTPGIESAVGSNGSPLFIRSIKKAYDYVVNKYNIDTNGVFVLGYSRGSLEAAQLALSRIIPVTACILYGPDLDLWKIEYTYKDATVKEKMTEDFGFEEKTASNLVSSIFPSYSGQTVYKPVTFSAAQTVPTDDEKAYILNNIEKWCSYNPLTAKLGDIVGGSEYEYWSKYNQAASSAEDALYNGNMITPTPIKLFVGLSDTITTYKYSKWFYNMCIRAGSNCELRAYTGVTHDYPNETASISVVLKDGKTYNTKVDCYEGLLYFRKFM